MSCSVAISSFLRHEVSFWVCGSAILILRRERIRLWISAFGVSLSYADKYSFRDQGFGDTLHWRLSYWRLTSLESIVLIVMTML